MGRAFIVLDDASVLHSHGLVCLRKVRVAKCLTCTQAYREYKPDRETQKIDMETHIHTVFCLFNPSFTSFL